MKGKKVALVTGASSGMGKATAELLAKEGYVVYGGARRVDAMGELKRLGGHPIALDMANPASIEEVVARIHKEQGQIDILVNNAGFGLYGSVEDTSIADAKYQFEVNVFGLGRITQLIVPIMRKQGAGTIVNISSMGGKMYTPLGAWYHATKHAIEGLSDCLRIELEPFGVKVVIIEPGIIRTNFGNVLMETLVERSKGGAYEEMVEKMVDGRDAVERSGSSPDLIAKTILKVIRAEKPKTRYLVGKFAKPLVCMRRTLGDRLFDRVIMSQVK